MDIARFETMQSAPARLPHRGRAGQAPTLSVVPREWCKGSMPTSEELNDWAKAVAATRDRQAFAALFKHFAPRVKAHLARAGCTPQAAEELAQETMISVWSKAISFDPQRAGLSTWIFTIARNLRIDRHRRDAGVPGSGGGWDDEDYLEQIADPAASPEEQLCTGRRESGVRQALATLSSEQTLLLRLSFYDEHPHSQIARELNIPLGTVKSRIRLAVHQLRRLLGDIEKS